VLILLPVINAESKYNLHQNRNFCTTDCKEMKEGIKERKNEN
jgi:hypothetical protein